MGALVADLLAVEDRDVTWLAAALQTATELELSTIPPYLCGLCSVVDHTTVAAALVRSVLSEEMLHLGLVCNMLTTIGGTPLLDAPVYPGPLPGGVRPGLTVYLSGLTPSYVADVYMQIEYPQDGPLAETATPTIGSFYTAIGEAFAGLPASAFTGERQLTTTVGGEPLYGIASAADAQRAVLEIKEQGEGTSTSPDAVGFGGELAHYYRFGEVAHGATLVPVGTSWEYAGTPVPFPQCRPMAAVPQGGWPDPAPAVTALLAMFDTAFGTVLDNLRAAWANGSQNDLDTAVATMGSLPGPATELMEIPLPGGSGTYGPDFRV
jgi:hypothetical protein